MEQQSVAPRETQYVNLMCGFARAGELWGQAQNGELDELLSKMSYSARYSSSKCDEPPVNQLMIWLELLRDLTNEALLSDFYAP